MRSVQKGLVSRSSTLLDMGRVSGLVVSAGVELG